MDVHKMLMMPKTSHFFNRENRMKVCPYRQECDKAIYGTRVVSTWFAKNEGKTIFDLITMSDIAYTIAVIENGHETWDEMIDTNEGRDSPKKTTKFTKRGGLKREYNTTGLSQEGIDCYNKVCEEWKKHPERTDFNFGKNWRMSGLSMLMRRDVAREDARSTRQTWKRQMLVPFHTCQDCRLRWSSLEMMIISLTAHGRILLMKEGMTILMSGIKLFLIYGLLKSALLF